MTGYYDQPTQRPVVFIKSLDDLEVAAEQRDYDAEFIFANYKVVDKTCNKDLKFNVSLTKAEARRQRQLAYKKHAKCEVVIEELHLVDNLIVSLCDVSRTSAYFDKIHNLRENTLENRIKRSEILALTNNINMNGKIKSISTDKIINTKNGPTRMMIVEFEDMSGETIDITIWGDMAEGLVEGASVEIRKAEINTYTYGKGLQVSRYGSVKVTSVPEKKVEQLVELPKDGLIMTLNFKTPNEVTIFLENVKPEIRREDRVFTDFVNGSITIRNPSRYERLGLKLTELGSVKNQPRSKRIEKLQGIIKNNFVTVGVMNDGPYGAKCTPIKENFAYEVVEGEEHKHISFMDKYSWKCGICDEKFGYQHDAEACSKKHIPHGKMLGDYVKSVIIKQAELIA